MEGKLYPSAPDSSSDVESMTNKQLAEVSGFKNFIQNIMMMM